MRFIVDECTGTKVAQWLKGQGYEVFSVYDEARGINDNEIIRKAFDDNFILIINDVPNYYKTIPFVVAH